MAQLVLNAAATAGANAAPQTFAQLAAQTAANAAATFAAGAIDSLIFGPQRRKSPGAVAGAIQIMTSTEGAPIQRVYGRTRLAGQVIWAAKFKASVVETSSGGKGARASAAGGGAQYKYSLSFAVGLCEGVIDGIGRVWADGKSFDLSGVTARVYTGAEDQAPDPLIEAIEGAGAVPGFRGLAYIVFEDLPLERLGNRVPQFSFEVMHSLRTEDPAALENVIEAACLIPASGEFAYATSKVGRTVEEGVTESENVNNSEGRADLTVSLDRLETILPACKAVSVFASWFGTDLRAGVCEVRPGVEISAKETAPLEWRAGGVDRSGAHIVSQADGAPLYGGTPDDASLVEAIADLKARGMFILFHPFILMDVPSGNGLPDPYTGGESQPAFPWRGRITVDPAPGVSGTVDKTAAARTQINALFGAAAISDFSITDRVVTYSGPAEWSLRRMVLHAAHLCLAAGGVDAFLLGSEMRGITSVRDETGAFPAVEAYKVLAADIRTVLGPSVKISYGADWSEYFGHQPTDGTGDVLFHLDPLWSDPNIDAVAIDNYMPLSDWRDGFGHLDAVSGAGTTYDLTYLKSNIQGGEGYDWYYASEADRDSQTRTLISDGAHGEDWVFRYKDLWNWWASAHHDRPGGVRSTTATGWVPQSKPVWFNELGCPAVDKGANQPNVFIDPKSAESAAPYFSNGRRDDLIQRRFLEAHHAFWSEAANNPISSVYGAPMVATDRMFVYAWDARPYPDFPARDDVWADAENWTFGHWLNGRAGRAPLRVLVEALAGEVAPDLADASALNGLVSGYVIDRPMSPRQMIEPLSALYQFDAVETGGALRFSPRDGRADITVDAEGLVEGGDGDRAFSRLQESDLPSRVIVGFIDEGADYQSGAAEALEPGALHDRATRVSAPVVLEAGEAEARARSILADAWVMRERAQFSLPPSYLAVEPGDVVRLKIDGDEVDLHTSEIELSSALECAAARTAPSVYDVALGAPRRRALEAAPLFGAPSSLLLDLPNLSGDDNPFAVRAAAFSAPWPGAVAVWRQAGAGAPVLAATAPAPAVMGRLDTDLAPAGIGRRVFGGPLRVRLQNGVLADVAMIDVLNGANLAAIEGAQGWEVIQFEKASLGGDGVWTLDGLLRGQAGTEESASIAAGARFVLLNEALGRIDAPDTLRGLSFTWLFGPEGEIPVAPDFTSFDQTVSGVGLRPLSPVHLAAFASGGDVSLSWIRRGRVGADDFDAREIPLGEETELYDVEILSGASVIRTVETSTKSYTYPAADILADFGAGGVYGPGGLDGTISFRVRQISQTVGAGRAAEATIAL